MRIREAHADELETLVDIWLRSVRATHTFLTESDIQALLPVVREQALPNLELWVLADDADRALGFMGLALSSVEALFLAPESTRRGGGRLLLEHARCLKGELTVDVNEQNPEATRFYLANGFVIVGRSDVDDAGRPFPLLHMREARPEPAILRTARLELIPVAEEDAESLRAIWIAPGVRRYLFDDEVLTEEQTLGLVAESVRCWRKEGTGLWTARTKERTVVGFAGFWYFRDPPELELLYGFDESVWGRGLATEAAHAVCEYGFDTLGLAEIVASTDAANASSVRVMEKLGMTFDRRGVVDGLDTVFYRLSKRPGRTTDNTDLTD